MPKRKRKRTDEEIQTIVLGLILLIALLWSIHTSAGEKPLCSTIDTSEPGRWECIEDKTGAHTTITRRWSDELRAKANRPITRLPNARLMANGEWLCDNGKRVRYYSRVTAGKVTADCNKKFGRR